MAITHVVFFLKRGRIEAVSLPFRGLIVAFYRPLPGRLHYRGRIMTVSRPYLMYPFAIISVYIV